VLFFGSSITYGTDLTATEAFTSALQARLNEARPTPGFCVLNFAQPGFAFDQKFAVAQVEVPRYRPALIMWESWVEWPEYRLIGDTAYGIADKRVRADGFLGMTGVPDALNRFPVSQPAVLPVSHADLRRARLPATRQPARGHGVRQREAQQGAAAGAVGGRETGAVPGATARPTVRETAASLPDWHARLLDYTLAHDIPTYPLQRELVDQDYLALRHDPAATTTPRAIAPWCRSWSASSSRSCRPTPDRPQRDTSLDLTNNLNAVGMAKVQTEN
jgi:hypothetical protein